MAILSSYCAYTVEQKWKDRIVFLSKHSKITLPKRSQRKSLGPLIKTAQPINLVEAVIEERTSD